jgi:hypothetical protein
MIEEIQNNTKLSDNIFSNLQKYKHEEYQYLNLLENILENGTWEEGTWKNGVWEYGIWQNGIWEDGTWKGGTWESGIWKGGYDKDGNYHTEGDSPDKW